MPLYVGEYLADTAHLTATQSGAYLHLIMHYWQHGSLPQENFQLAMIAKLPQSDFENMKALLFEFFSDGWKHKRVERELLLAKEAHNRRSAAGRLGGRPKSVQTKAMLYPEKSNASVPEKQCFVHIHRQNTNANALDGEPSDYPTEIRERLWAEGVDSLVRMGISIRDARSNIGRWLKTHDPGHILDAIRRAREHQTKDPIPLVTRILTPLAKGRRSVIDAADDLADKLSDLGRK